MKNELFQDYCPGPIVLFGSGETSPSGGKIFEVVFSNMPIPPNVALIETPAGFELNSAQVMQRVGDFITRRLQNYEPKIEIIQARMRGTAYSPDDPQIAAPLLKADLIFMGPGSPSYAIRQLQDSLTWHYLIARHRLGAGLAFASAAAIAISSSGHVHRFQRGESFQLERIGPFIHPNPTEGLPLDVWENALEIHRESAQQSVREDRPPQKVLAMVEGRTLARKDKDWAKADQLRDAIEELGWKVVDTPEGPALSKSKRLPDSPGSKPINGLFTFKTRR